MLRQPVIRMVVSSCIALCALCAACDGAAPKIDEGPISAETEVNLVISDPATASEELAMLIDFVSYRITCPSSGLTPYDDSVDLSGNFEALVDSNPAVWQLVTDLPLSSCTITLWVFYEDEVVCSGFQSMPVLDDGDPSAPNKVNIVLECSLSVIPPSGDLDIDGNFELVHGNYCPQLFWLGAVPQVVAPAVPAVTDLQTSYMDIDNTCGQNCDPQTCDFVANPPTCTPAPDPGLSSTFFAPAGKGTFGDVNALNTTFTCDPAYPGPTEICVRVSDGDLDCDQVRCLTIECPDLCAGVTCDDGNECTRDHCDPLTGVCSNDPAPDGIACNNCDATCQAGACTGAPFTADFNSNFMFIQADLGAYSATLVNPYSGESVPVSGTFRVNNASYKGIGTADVLSGVNQGEVLLIKDGVYPQTVCGVETILGQGGFDVLFLADGFITLQDMVIDGGNTNDLIWANAGQDTIQGNNGDDRLDGGPGNDIIEGGNGNDTITLWPGSGFDSISGGLGTDRVEIYAIQSQIEITPAVNASYAFDIAYLGVPLAQIREVEFVVLEDATIDLSTCTGGAADVCNLCGNDALNGSEQCDDGNNLSGDGCAANCTAEY